MNLECSCTLVLNQPYDQARRRILAALKEQGLQVAFDFDVSSGILRSSGVRLPKCSVLGASCPYQLLEAVVADAAAALYFPLHVVLSEHGAETRVRILAAQTLRAAGVAPAISIPVHRTLRRVHDALALVGARQVVLWRRPSSFVACEGGRRPRQSSAPRDIRHNVSDALR